MAQHLLLLSYDDELHKCHFLCGEERNITVGNDLSDTVTFPTLPERLSIIWDGTSCIIGETKLASHDRVTIHLNDKPLRAYVIDASHAYSFDVSSKRSVLIGAIRRYSIKGYESGRFTLSGVTG